MSLKSSLVVHRGVALVMCESSAILEETLRALDSSSLSQLHMQRLGDRALAMPAYEVEIVRRALEERGIYPKIVGTLEESSDSSKEDDEEEDV